MAVDCYYDHARCRSKRYSVVFSMVLLRGESACNCTTHHPLVMSTTCVCVSDWAGSGPTRPMLYSFFVSMSESAALSAVVADR